MRSVGEWLRELPLTPPPSPRAGDATPEYEFSRFHLLGADLPLGHLHVWAGPPGAGKTAFLLGLLHAAARHGRIAVLASYDLAGPSVALRCLAMAAGVSVAALEQGRLDPAAAARAARARASLELLPLHVIEARGMGVASIEDRLARFPERVQVLGVDALQSVVRLPGRAPGDALRDLADLASRLHVAVVCASRASPPEPSAPAGPSFVPDRVGWLASPDATGACEAHVLANRHGREIACPLRLDRDSARLVPPS